MSTSQGGSSHWIAVSGGKRYPLPLHNGLKSEVAEIYIRKVCIADLVA